MYFLKPIISGNMGNRGTYGEVSVRNEGHVLKTGGKVILTI